MERITVKAYAKINLSLDILGIREDGYHEVDMVMQLTTLHDHITLSAAEEDSLTCSDGAVPTGQENLAWQAKELLGNGAPVSIRIEKNIPMAAGLAGGSADGAAVLLGLNKLWGLSRSMEDLMALAGQLGSDVPFALQGICAAHPELRPKGYEETRYGTCARARGRGTELTPLPALQAGLLLCKLPVSVSTGAAYAAMDDPAVQERIGRRPDTERLCLALKGEDLVAACGAMGNVMEAYTLAAHPDVARLKAKMEAAFTDGIVQMSGSGPTLFALVPEGTETRFSAGEGVWHAACELLL